MDLLSILENCIFSYSRKILLLVRELLVNKSPKALEKLNLCLIENNLPEIKIESKKELFYDKNNKRFVKFNYLLLGDGPNKKDTLEKVTSESKISEHFQLDYCSETVNGIKDFCKRLNNYCNLCEEFNIKKDKIKSPRDWLFVVSNMEIPGFIKAFSRICTLPEEKWFE